MDVFALLYTDCVNADVYNDESLLSVGLEEFNGFVH